MIAQMETAILGGGCFWCMEALFQRIKGVHNVQSGYCGGKSEKPSYKQVKTGNTGHYQVIKVQFQPNVISYSRIIEIFLHVHDPTQQDGQGQDIGSQYKSVIFFESTQQEQIAKEQIKKYENETGKKVATQVKAKQPYFKAEDYHQNYFNEKGSENPYCDIIPIKIKKMQGLFKQETIV